MYSNNQPTRCSASADGTCLGGDLERRRSVKVTLTYASYRSRCGKKKTLDCSIKRTVRCGLNISSSSRAVAERLARGRNTPRFISHTRLTLALPLSQTGLPKNIARFPRPERLGRTQGPCASGLGRWIRHTSRMLSPWPRHGICPAAEKRFHGPSPWEITKISKAEFR